MVEDHTPLEHTCAECFPPPVAADTMSTARKSQDRRAVNTTPAGRSLGECLVETSFVLRRVLLGPECLRRPGLQDWRYYARRQSSIVQSTLLLSYLGLGGVLAAFPYGGVQCNKVHTDTSLSIRTILHQVYIKLAIINKRTTIDSSVNHNHIS